MKKLVTIRKARKGEKPGFVNKTAKFLKKAEMGTEVQSGSGEYNEKILEYVAEQILEQGQDAESVYKTLIESKIEPEVAAEHVQAILNFQQNMQQEEAAQVTDETAGEETAYTQAANEVEEDLASNYGYYDSSGQGTQLAASDEEEEESNAYDDQMVTDIVNNEWTGQDGGVIDQYIVNNYLPVTGDLSQDDYNAFNYKTGGKVSKRTFMKNVMSELKKAREGMEQEAQQSPEQKFDTTDTLLLDRNKKKDSFVTALSKTTREAKDKEKAEQMWQQQQMMMQQPQMQMDPSIPMLNRQAGGPAMEADPSQYTHYTHGENDIFHDQMNTMLTARGGMAMPSPREYKKMHRQVSRMLPNLYLDPNIKASELDVRKTGMFGRPKQYSIKFQGNQGITPGWAHGTLLLGLPGGANMMPNVYNPFGMFGSASSYGGGYTKGIVETKKVLDTGRMRPVSRTPNQPGVPYGGYSDNPAPAGTTIGTDAQGNRIAIAPTAPGTTPQNETWQNYNPTVVPGVNPIVAPNFNSAQSANVGDTYVDIFDEMIKKYPPTIGQDHDDWMASWNGSVGFVPDHTKWDGTQFKEMGGFVDPSNPELYKFIYGGGDNMFEDDMNTINTADPYFGRMYSNGGRVFKTGNKEFNITNPEKIVSTPPNQYQSPAYQQFNPNATSGSNYAAFLELQKRGLAQGSYDPGKSYDISNTNPGTTTNTTTTTQQRPTTTSNQVVTNFSNIPGYRSNGLIDTLFSANVMPEYLGTWSKIKGVRTANGQPFTGFNANTVLNEIDVRRSGMRGQPKAYTMKFNQYTDPRDANKITLNPMENRINDPNDPMNQRQGVSNMSGRDRRIARRDERLNRDIPAESDAYQFTGTLTGSPVTSAKEPLSNEEMLKAQGKEWSEEQQKWVSSVSPVSATNTSPTKNTERDAIINAPDQQSNIHAFPGPDMSNIPSGSNMSQDQAFQALFKSRMANGQGPRDGSGSSRITSNSAEEIKVPDISGSSNPTSDNNSNTPAVDNIPNRSYLEKGIQPYQQQFTDPFSSLQQFVNPSSSADSSEFSANPMSTASQPRNPDYEQQSEYQFGVNPLTNNSNEIGLSNTNPEYAQMNEPSIFEEEEVIEQKPSTPSGTPRRGVSTMASRGYTPSEINTKVSKWKPKYETVDPSKHDIAYYKKVNYFDQLDKVSDARLRAERKLDPNLSPKQKQQALNNLLAIQQKMEEQIEKDWERTWGKQSLKRYGGLATFNPGGGVSYTNNPAFVGKSNIDLLSENGDVAVPNLQPSSFWADSQSFNKPQPTPFDNCTEDQKKDPTSPCYEGYTIDPNQQISDTLKKEMMDSNEIEIDAKNKNVYGVNLEADLAFGNKLASVFPAIQNRREANKLLGNKKLKKLSDALYANNPAGDPWQSKGQYSVSGSTYGEFDPRNAGQINYSGRSQYGGSIYKEGGVAYMSADELQKFMEEGGEIEFI
jgi:hypothetical protein